MKLFNWFKKKEKVELEEGFYVDDNGYYKHYMKSCKVCGKDFPELIVNLYEGFDKICQKCDTRYRFISIKNCDGSIDFGLFQISGIEAIKSYIDFIENNYIGEDYLGDLKGLYDELAELMAKNRQKILDQILSK